MHDVQNHVTDWQTKMTQWSTTTHSLIKNTIAQIKKEDFLKNFSYTILTNGVHGGIYCIQHWKSTLLWTGVAYSAIRTIFIILQRLCTTQKNQGLWYTLFSGMLLACAAHWIKESSRTENLESYIQKNATAATTTSALLTTFECLLTQEIKFQLTTQELLKQITGKNDQLNAFQQQLNEIKTQCKIEKNQHTKELKEVQAELKDTQTQLHDVEKKLSEALNIKAQQQKDHQTVMDQLNADICRLQKILLTKQKGEFFLS
jgi:hypothetical protein